MNKELIGEQHPLVSKPSLFGLPKPLAAALIGVVIYLLILLPVNLLQEKSTVLSFVSLDLELLGRMTIGILGMFTELSLPKTLYNLLSAIISAIPPAILGALIGSSRKWMRITGIVLLVIYLLITLIFGSILILMAI